MIEVTRLYKAFDTPVLRGVNLQVGPGRILGLIGPPACGKTLLLRAIAGLSGVDAGSIVVFGRQMVDAEPQVRRELQGRIGMLFQNVALFDFMTVFDNVAFPLRRLSRWSEAEIAERVASELSAVGLWEARARMPTNLSGGQKRRVGLARAVVTAPQVLLYDEPAAGLDPVTSSRTFALLQDQQRRLGAAIIVVSSDIDRLLPICDQVAMMHGGRILFQGDEAQLRGTTHPVTRQFLDGDIHGPL